MLVIHTLEQDTINYVINVTVSYLTFYAYNRINYDDDVSIDPVDGEHRV